MVVGIDSYVTLTFHWQLIGSGVTLENGPCCNLLDQ